MENSKITISRNELIVIIDYLKENNSIGDIKALRLLGDMVQNTEIKSTKIDFEEQLRIPLKLFKELVKIYLKSLDIPIDFPHDF